MMKVAGTVSFSSHNYQWNLIAACKIIQGITLCPTPLTFYSHQEVLYFNILERSCVSLIVAQALHSQVYTTWYICIS